MKVGFFGWYDRGNCGDEAFKDAFQALLPSVEKEFCCKIPKCDKLVLGGGDVIKPYYLDMIGDREFFILGAGLGYESELDLLAGMKVKKAILRNRRDAALAIGKGINAVYAPDVVFGLEPPVKVRARGDKKRAVVILNDAISPSWNKRGKCSELAYAEYMKWEIAACLSELGEWYDFTFLPFSFERYNMDVKTHADVVQRMSMVTAGTEVLHSTVQPLTALNHISGADLVITMKFHGVIFSTLSSTPFVNIGLSRKTQQFCKEEGLSGLSVAPYAFSRDTFFEAVKAAEDLDPLMLTNITAHNKELLQRAFKAVEDELCV